MGSDSINNICLDLLSVDEAMDLFAHCAEEVSNQELAKQIVQKCDGHPLSLRVLGRLLKRKAAHEWEDILTQLSNIPGQQIQEKVLTVLELSYKYLTEEQQSVFLLCGLLGQPQISSMVLLTYCWGLGLFQGVYKVVDAWNRLLTLIRQLEDSSLIISFDKDDALITIHDMVRDTAAFIASKDQKAFTIRSDSELNIWQGNSLIHNSPWIFFPYCDISELPRILECPNLKCFMFQAADRNINLPNSFFEIATNLPVVTLNKITFVLPMSLKSLTNLRTLCLHDCILSDVTFIGCLDKMEVLSFRGSNLQCVPSELRKLKRLKLLDLHNCKWLTCFPELVLSNLSQLEELYMGNTSVEWDSPGNASLSELESLRHLTTLEIQFPVGKTMPEGVVCGNLKRFRISFTRQWNLDTTPPALRTLALPTKSVLAQDMKALLTKTECLQIGNIRGMRNAHFDLEVDVLDHIRRLLIVLADDLEYVVSSTDSNRSVFPRLETLQVRNTKKLKSICGGQLSTGSLSHLKTLILYKCDSLKDVFSLSMAKSLEQLETLNIQLCSNLEEIIYVNTNDNNIVGNDSLKLAKLVNLDLWFLPQLRCFMHTGTSLSQSSSAGSSQNQPLFDNKVLLPSLESLSLYDLPKVETIWPDQLDHGSFAKLKDLKIVSCSGLRTVFQETISTKFMALSKLEIRDCEMLEEIYKFPAAQEVEEMESKLAYVSLENMAKLECIWRNKPSESLLFQSMDSIIIIDCHSLKAVFPSSIASQLMQLKVLHLHKIGCKEIVSQEECGSSSTYFSFPQLTVLKLEYLPNLEAFYRQNHEVQVPKLKSLGTTMADPQGQFSSAVLLTDTVFLGLTELSINGDLLKIITESPRLIELVSKVRSLVLYTFEGSSLISSSFLLFSCLQKLYIRDSKIENIFINEMNRGDDGGSSIVSSDPLRSLKLENVTCMKTLTLRDPFLQNLETLELYSCCDVMHISTASFRNLSCLIIDRCDNLVSVLPFSIAKTMEHLVKMTLRFCSSLKEVVCAEEGQVVDAETQLCITFSKLKTVVLENLSSLVSFCSERIIFQFPFLEEVTVVGCPNMEVFSRGTISTPRLKNVIGTTWQCAADLNSTVSELYRGMVGFRDLDEITLSKFPQLQDRWHGELSFKLCALLQKVVIDNCVSNSVSVPLKHFDVTIPWQLIIENCESMEEIFYLEGLESSENRAVALIWFLKLSNLPNLRNTWNIAPANILRFGLLKILHIEKCDTLANVFSLSSALVLSSLQQLSVNNCAAVTLFLKGGAEAEVDWDGYTLFPSLKMLALFGLPNLATFYESDYVFKTQSLSTVFVINCPKLSVLDSTGSNGGQRLFNGQVDIGRRLEDIQITVSSMV